jgi:hypothetical protein
MDDSNNTFQRVQILLHEYNTLRAEVLSRYVAQFQSGGVASIVLLGIFTLIANLGFSYWFIGLVGLDLILFAAVLVWIDIDIAKAARRLRELEVQINSLAGGEALLKWESVWGIGGVTGKHILRWLGI